MTADFFRFPHTPHIQWLGKEKPREDKLLSDFSVQKMLAAELTIEEKLDGANIGFSIGPDGQIRAQNRGAWIEQDVCGQFKHLWSWVKRYEMGLIDHLSESLILFGEWCYAQHSVAYSALPDMFIGFDVYDRSQQQFYSVKKRNELFELLDISAIPPLVTGHLSLAELHILLDRPSNYGARYLEGIYLRQDNDLWLQQRAKLVRNDFIQAIKEHWSKKKIIPNLLDRY